jgi:hypothetical protein
LPSATVSLLFWATLFSHSAWDATRPFTPFIVAYISERFQVVSSSTRIHTLAINTLHCPDFKSQRLSVYSGLHLSTFRQNNHRLLAMNYPVPSQSSPPARQGRRPKKESEGSSTSPEAGQKQPKKVNSELRKQQNRIASRNYRKLDPFQLTTVVCLY